MTEHPVVIAGGGPTGLMLAAELRLGGVEALVVERRLSQELDGSRAGGLHARTIEVLEQRGVAERFVTAGQAHPVFGFAGAPLDLSHMPTRHNYVLALWQSHFERILADWVLGELGVPIIRGLEVVGLAQDEAGVDVAISDGTFRRAEYLIGCDGGRSVVRKAAGIEFVGLDATTSWMIAEVEMRDEPEFGFRHDRLGSHAIGRRGEDEPIHVVLVEPDTSQVGDPSMEDLRTALRRVYGTDFGVHSPSWISRFTDATRQAANYRQGRVLVAGDAAHIHPPQGGQGMGTGVQDAVNLGWKLAQVVNEISPAGLLDTYNDERHPVGARVLRNTRAQVVLGKNDELHQALKDTVAELVVMDEPRRAIAANLTGLDTRYDLGDGHPLLGRRMPDLDLETADGPTRLFALLHDARPVLLDLDTSNGVHEQPSATRVRVIHAKPLGVCEIPVVGPVETPPAVLIRPDGHVAWAGDLADSALPGVIENWFGRPD